MDLGASVLELIMPTAGAGSSRMARWSCFSARSGSWPSSSCTTCCSASTRSSGTSPIIGHFRYWLEAVGPELRQYIVTNNNGERPFSRDQRRWVYASSKQANTSFGFGSDQEMERQSNYLVIKHETFPLQTPGPGDPAYDPQSTIACAKVLGAARGRAKAFRPASVVKRLGHELRIAERPGGRSAQPRGADRRLPAQYRRRGRLALSPQRGGTWSGRSAPATSAAVRPTAASAWRGCKRPSRGVRRFARSRSN